MIYGLFLMSEEHKRNVWWKTNSPDSLTSLVLSGKLVSCDSAGSLRTAEVCLRLGGLCNTRREMLGLVVWGSQTNLRNTPSDTSSGRSGRSLEMAAGLALVLGAN